jgi:predicted RNase H-like HicB family nuclease
MTNVYTAIIGREDDIYVAFCPELDIASQGATVEKAKENLTEAVELFLETADESEILHRTRPESYVTSFEVSVG